MPPLRWLALCGLGAALALALLPTSASACSKGATCSPPVRLFPAGARVPGNLIYFEVTTAEPGVLTLRTSDGRPVPASIRSIGRHRVFAPDAEVPPDQHLELAYTTVCPVPGPLATPATFAFTTSAAQALEIPTPKLMLADAGEGSDHPGAHGSLVSYVTLKYEAVCETCSAAHLTDTHFDGDDGWGQVGQDRIDLLTTCEGIQIHNSCTGELLAPPGRYRVQAWSSVVGAPDEPVRAVREVELRCGLDGCAVRGTGRSTEAGGALLAWVALALVSARRRARAAG